MHVTYEQAAKMLGKKQDTIAHAVSDGTLIPYPRKSRIRYLESEQIELFKDKPLNRRALTPDEMETWTLLKIRIEASEQTETALTPAISQQTDIIKILEMFVDLVRAHTRTEREVPQGENPTMKNRVPVS